MTIPVTPSLVMRPLRRGDEDDIFAAIDNGRGHWGRWLPFVAMTLSVEDSRAFVEATIGGSASDPVFTLRLDGGFIGLVGFKETARDGSSTEIGYWMGESFEGRGYMTAAVGELVRRALGDGSEGAQGTPKASEVVIKCAVGNLRSGAIPRRLGFTFRRVEPAGEVVAEGVFRDVEVYSLRRER